MKKPKRKKPRVIRESMPAALKREPKWVQDAWKRSRKTRGGTVLTPEREKEILERGKLLRPADALPGEWIKLPAMKWPETLPVKVPDDVYSWLYAKHASHHWFTREMICAVFGRICPIRPSDAERQSAWSETLVRLGYTEDA